MLKDKQVTTHSKKYLNSADLKVLSVVQCLCAEGDCSSLLLFMGSSFGRNCLL